LNTSTVAMTSMLTAIGPRRAPIRRAIKAPNPEGSRAFGFQPCKVRVRSL
jgi:hypothetical protein